jgi:CDP-glucose 4,6-dehydratase
VEKLVIQAAFWQDRRVLLTGHTGFKGSWLCLWLQKMGARVIGYALPPATQPNLFELARVEQQMVSILADVRDADRLRSALTTHQPEVVFHLAAQAEILPSYAQPVDTYATNVMGTVNLLDAVRHSPGVRAVVVVTSDKCYENAESGIATAKATRSAAPTPTAAARPAPNWSAPRIARPSSTRPITRATVRR